MLITLKEFFIVGNIFKSNKKIVDKSDQNKKSIDKKISKREIIYNI